MPCVFILVTTTTEQPTTILYGGDTGDFEDADVGVGQTGSHELDDYGDDSDEGPYFCDVRKIFGFF